MTKQVGATGPHGATTLTPLIHKDLSKISYVSHHHGSDRDEKQFNDKNHSAANSNKMIAHLKTHGEAAHKLEGETHFKLDGHSFVHDNRDETHIIHGTHEGLTHLANVSGAKSSAKAIIQHGPDAPLYHEDMHDSAKPALRAQGHLNESFVKKYADFIAEEIRNKF